MGPPPSTSIATYFADASLILFMLFLVLLSGFFAVTEFTIVKLRATRVETIARQHGWHSAILRKVHNQLDTYLSACQLGITLVSLGLGWVGEPAFAELPEPLLAMISVYPDELTRSISFFIALLIISYLHIVVGELAPKSWVIRRPELLSLWTAAPLYLFYWLMHLVVWLLSASVDTILRIVGQDEPSPRHEHHYNRDELKLVLHSSYAQGPSGQGMYMLTLAVELSKLGAVDWANSREDLVYPGYGVLPADILAVVRHRRCGHYPTQDNHKGEFIDLLHIKDLLPTLSTLDSLLETFDLDELVRPLEIVTEHTSLSRLLEQFRKGGVHFAMVEEANHKVVDFLTMENVLEVLVSDIQDEHCKTERGILAYQPDELLVHGDIPLFRLERLLDIDLDHVKTNILAGLAYDILKWVLEEGEVLGTGGLRIIMKKTRGSKIVLARVVKLD